MIDSSLSGARVLVTGATGFIGAHLAARLVSLGAEVHGTGRAPPPSLSMTMHAAQLDDPASLAELATALRPEVTFHLAARTERDRRLELLGPMLRANALSVAALCEALGAGARVVVVGSGEDYGVAPGPWVETLRERPVSPYGLSKLVAAAIAETAAASFGVRAVVGRPSVVYGPGQRGGQFLPSLIATLLAGERFPMTAGEQLRDFLFVDDLVEALVQLGTDGPFGRVFNLSRGESTRIVDLARTVHSIIGRGELDIGALPYRPAEAMVQEMSPAAAREAFGWSAQIGLEEGLRRTIAAAAAR